jgi:tRNA pseudouridine55 synthase
MARRRKGLAVNGWICLDKPYGLGSTPAVAKVRWIFEAQKAGHAGTLDPLASGVLPVALGEATKTVSFMTEAEKDYSFTIAFGVSTATLDAEGEVTARSEARPSRAGLEAAIPAFLGDIEQVPPAYSAIKIDGERAYALSRAGKIAEGGPEMAARPAFVRSLALTGFDGEAADFEVTCGKGFYIRSLARDLCVAVGVEGHVSRLRRTRVGPFGAAGAITLENLEHLRHKAAALEALLPVETALDDIPALALTAEDAAKLSQGRAVTLLPGQVEALQTIRPDGAQTVLARQGDAPVAICELRAGRLNPVRVFNL